MDKHKVRTHSWKGGVLKILEQEFETIVEAIEFGRAHPEISSFKIYDEEGSLFHSEKPNINLQNSYANPEGSYADPDSQNSYANYA